jgi:hypothetical protein
MTSRSTLSLCARGLIDVAGLAVEALYGWFDLSPFADDSREFVWVTRKPT